MKDSNSSQIIGTDHGHFDIKISAQNLFLSHINHMHIKLQAVQYSGKASHPL